MSRSPVALAETTQALTQYLDSLFRDSAPAAAAVAPLASVPAPAPAPQPEPEVDWRAAPFDALVLDLGGCHVAMRLVDVALVRPCPARLTVLPGTAPWVLGVLADADTRATVLDSSTVLEIAGVAAGSTLRSHVAVLGSGRWALAAADAGRVARVAPQDVRWRASGGARPWFAGIVIASLCPLIDAPALVAALDDGAVAPAGTTHAFRAQVSQA